MVRVGVELRAEITGDTLAGHVAVFGQVARVPGHYEALERSAFDAVLESSDARFLLNHNPDNLLGREGAGTLRLRTDELGLAFEVDLPDTAVARDVRELVRRGDLNGGSFAFVPGEDRWTLAPDGVQLRTHTSIERLLDASVVTFPAYQGTDMVLRALPFMAIPAGRSQMVRSRARIRGGI